MTAFLLSLARSGSVLSLGSLFGWMCGAALFPAERAFRAERLGWGCAVGSALLSVVVPLSFLASLRPGWIPFLLLASTLGAVGHRFRLPAAARTIDGWGDRRLQRLLRAALWSLVLVGIVLYGVRALTEPMWSNDFVAIWGLKGKTIFGSVAVPSRLHRWPQLAFTHPEYPLGLPFLYAGVSFLTGRWDDHAMALLFPFFQIATLAVLYGWLRRRGASEGVALSAAVLLAGFEPLYSSFLTGMAEVPLSFGLLLFGTALVDALDALDRGALRRVVLASALLAATKNEGLFFAAAGSVLALSSGAPRRLRVALAALPAGLLVHALHIAWRGPLPLRDFDFSLASRSRWGELSARVAAALEAALRVLTPAGWAGLCGIAVLIAAGKRVASGDRLLILAACGLTVYLLLPAFAVADPAWLVNTTLRRTGSALAPLVAAGVAARLGSVTRRRPPETL